VLADPYALICDVVNTNGIQPGDLLSVAQVAAYLGCSASTVYRHCRSGELGYFRLGPSGDIRISNYHLEWFLRSHLDKATDQARGDAVAAGKASQ
jgi:excisionase family DNA binding protein